MPYDRTYTIDDVARILDESEHRPRPGASSPGAPKGHAISAHSRERRDMFARKKGDEPPSKDSVFLIDRNSLVAIIHEALNSPPGQRELAKLNAPAIGSVWISCVILRQGHGFDIFTVYRPKQKGSQFSFDWLSTSPGDGFIVEVRIWVHKMPGTSAQDIHVQTAFPASYARTSGEEIVHIRR